MDEITKEKIKIIDTYQNYLNDIQKLLDKYTNEMVESIPLEYKEIAKELKEINHELYDVYEDSKKELAFFRKELHRSRSE